jgi:ferredoxin-NADP reductase
MQKVKLLQKKFIAKDTLALWVERPKGFRFESGQYIDLGFEDRTLPDYERFRELTLANSPQEDALLLVFRMRDSIYKERMRDMPLGTPLLLMGPHGQLVLHTEVNIPAVFIAGGIGIAPFRSMIFDSLNRQSKQKLFLFYSNHSQDEAAFLKELQDASMKNPNVTFVPTLTEKTPTSHWTGERGYISQQMIQKYLDSGLSDSRTLQSCIYYLCGFPEMVFDMRMMLSQAGVSGSNIRSESFTGY